MKSDSYTIYDIAKEAGVSAATVSRVMNNKGYASDEARKRVEAVIEKYNFKPSVIASSLKTSQTKTIGMVVPDVRNAFYSTVFVAIEDEAAKYGYNVILCNSTNSLEKDSSYIDMLFQRKVDVLIELGGQMDRAKPDKQFVAMLKHIMDNVMFFGPGFYADKRQLSIDIDDGPAIAKVINAKLKEGKQTFAMIGGDPNIIASKKKHDHFLKALSDAGVNKSKVSLEATGGYNLWHGRDGVKNLLAKGEIPEVIFGINEMVAIGIMSELEKEGLLDKTEIIAFDNTFMAETTTPELSCIAVDYEEYARMVMKLIMDVSADPSAKRVGMCESKVFIRGSLKL